MKKRSAPKEFWVRPHPIDSERGGSYYPAYERDLKTPGATHVIEKVAYDKLKAELWVAKDSQLRTYDGLAQKADRCDDAEAKLRVAMAYLYELHIKLLDEYGVDHWNHIAEFLENK